MIVPPDMDKIKRIADDLAEEIEVLETKLENENCEHKINELRYEIRSKGLTLFDYQRTLNSNKYN